MTSTHFSTPAMTTPRGPDVTTVPLCNYRTPTPEAQMTPDYRTVHSFIEVQVP